MKHNAALMVMVLSVVLMSNTGCLLGPQGPGYTPNEQRQILGSIIADRIKVVGPFTRPVSFDNDAIPDGIEVVLQPLDQQGEPTKLAGNLVFELYTYRPASAEPKGQLAQTWRHSLSSKKDQDARWDRATRMYKFQLMVDKTTMPKSSKYVILARYTNPWNEHFEDEAVIDLTGLLYEIKQELLGSAME